MRRLSRSGSVGRSNGNLEKLSDNPESPKKNKKPKRTIIKDFFIDYTANSNLHGLKYIGEKERTILEKFFWFIAFVCCVSLCGYLIRQVYIKWNITPVIVSFAETTTPVWQIPYPAVTFCFETKAMQRKFNFTETYHQYQNKTTRANMTEEEIELFEDITLICDDYLAPKDGRKFSDGREIVDNIKSVAPNISEQFFGCKWKDIPKESCEHLFSPILTEEGLCYSFNMLTTEELFRVENLHNDYPYIEIDKALPSNLTLQWNLEDGYGVDDQIETYPHRGTGFGTKSGMTFLMKSKEIDLDYLCRGPVQGFKILLHNPAELPRLSQQYFRSPLAQEVVVAIKPKMMTTSEGLRPYLPERRQCYFPSERYLKYFKIYTQSNCEMECLTNFTYMRCGCVQFGMLHGPDMKVCNSGSLPCLKAAQMDLVVIEAEERLKKETNNGTMNKALEVAKNCRCLPACTSIEYEAETSQADFNWREIFYAHRSPIPEEEMDMMYARVMVFFKEPQFITSRRSELYGLTDFLANCGGLLGLFMGFSILSVAEILYFLTLRLCCAMCGRKNKNKTDILNNAKKSID